MTDTVHITDTKVSSYSDKLGSPTVCGKATGVVRQALLRLVGHRIPDESGELSE